MQVVDYPGEREISKYQHHTCNYCRDIQLSNILGPNLPDPVLNYTEDEFDDIEDVYLEDVEDDDSNSATPPHLLPCDTPS